MKTLILYLSASGNTARLAKCLAEKLENVEVKEVVLQTKIPENDFWMHCKFGFLLIFNAGFRYRVPVLNVQDYDRVIIGSPIWIGRAAPPLLRVIKKYDLAYKVDGAFVTCGGESHDIFARMAKSLDLRSIKHTLVVKDSESLESPNVQARLDKFVDQISAVEDAVELCTQYTHE